MHGKSSMVHYDEKGEEGLFSGLSKYESGFSVLYNIVNHKSVRMCNETNLVGLLVSALSL